MAEFSEVIRQFDRMCKAHAGCLDCPFAVAGDITCSIQNFINNPKRIESSVMKWAAEHPEPMYPTWGEWLESMWDVNEHNSFGDFVYHTPIPADIAEKLGIEPKEDV